MKLRGKKDVLDDLILDEDLSKTADNYQPDPLFEEDETRPGEGSDSKATLGVWIYTEEDPAPQMPEFEGTFEECVARAEEIAREHGFHPVTDSTVIGRHWSNDKGDSIMIE